MCGLKSVDQIVKHVHRRTATVKWWIRGDIEEVKIANIEHMDGTTGTRHSAPSSSECFLSVHFHYLA